MKRALVSIAILFLTLTPLAGHARTPTGIELLESIQSVFVEVVERVQDGVVSVAPVENGDRGNPFFPNAPAPGDPHGGNPHGGMPHPPFGPEEDDGPGHGAGIIIDKGGHVVTNAHVVGNAREMSVRLRDGRRFPARLVGADPETDLAVLRIDWDPKTDAPLPVLAMGDSEQVHPGQWTIAVGNPFGLERTVTVGIVSGVGREGVNLTRYENFIQTDAPINPGNSGGPLFNVRGEVIGITTAIMSYAQGIGFAIPSNMAARISGQLIESGNVERGWLGVGIQPINADLAQTFGVGEDAGVLVNEVFSGQPAAESGLLPGDIIVGLNGKAVASPNTLSRLIAGLGPESVARLDVLRDGREHKLKATLAHRPAVAPVAAPAPKPPAPHRSLGMDLQNLTPELAAELGVAEGGVLVSSVDPNGAAFRKGIREGDVIREVNRVPVTDVDALAEVLKSRRPGEKILLRAIHQGRGHYVVLEPVNSPTP